MDIENFKKKCKDIKDKEEEERVAGEKRYDDLIHEQKKYKTSCYAPKWKRNHWWEKNPYCPNCGELLIIEEIKHSQAFYPVRIYSCPCGYKYAN